MKGIAAAILIAGMLIAGTMVYVVGRSDSDARREQSIRDCEAQHEAYVQAPEGGWGGTRGGSWGQPGITDCTFAP